MMKNTLLLSATVLLVFGANTFAQVETSKKPNIVFLMTDDQRWDTLGCYGRPEFQTENIDKLAAEGVVFDTAYQAVAICMPSRASVMTGRYFASHNSGFTYPHNSTVPESHFADTYHARLKAAGYRSGFIGKFGFHVDGALETLKKHFDYMDAHATHTNFKGRPRWAENMEGFDEIHRKGRDPKERTLMKGDSMLSFLDTQPEGKPFVLSVYFDAVKNDSDRQMYGPDTEVFEDKDFPVPEDWVEGANETLPQVVQKHARGYGLHKARSSTPEQFQRNIRRFATQGLTVDNQVGRLVKKLKEMNILDNTVIIYTSDNGRYHGSHGLFSKELLHDASVKAPLIIWDGRVASKENAHRVSEVTSSVDMGPTMLSLAGVEIPQRMQGHSLVGIVNKTQDMSKWRDAVLIENLFLQEMHSATEKAKKAGAKFDGEALNNEIIAGNRSYRSRGVRTDRFKYFAYYEHDPVIEELYDMQADPHEQKNLSAHPEYQQVLEKMRNQTEELYEQVVGKQSALKLKLK